MITKWSLLESGETHYAFCREGLSAGREIGRDLPERDRNASIVLGARHLR